MSKDLKQRIEKLERQVGVAGFEIKLRALVRRWGGNEEAYLRAARSYERQLGQALGEDGGITWEGFLLLRDLLHLRATPHPHPGEKVRLPSGAENRRKHAPNREK